MPDRMPFDLQLGSTPSTRPVPRDTSDPLRILILGSFGTRAVDTNDLYPAAIRLDIDNFEAKMRSLAPHLQVSLEPNQKPLSLRFDSLDDFHPDALYQQVDVFTEMRSLRNRLSNPETFEAAAAQCRPTSKPSLSAATQTPVEEDAEMLSRLLGARPAAAAQPHAGLTGFINRLVAPYITPDNSARQSAYLDGVDQASSSLMSNLLHHPDFQALEASWRALQDLVSRSDDSIQIQLLDVDKATLASDVLRGPIESSQLFQRLITEDADIPGAPPWSLLIGNYTFGTQADDISLLAALAQLAAHAGAPFIAAADPAITGKAPSPAPDPAQHEQWQRLRHSTLAPWLGLLLPRVLLRLPYGADTDPIESFPFEEQGMQQDHSAYLWGNPAFACARLLSSAFQEDGFDLQPDAHRTLDDLPAHSYIVNSETEMQACAEAYLSEHEGETLAEQGFMPLLSLKGRPEAQLLRFQSIAEPPVALMGAWA